MYMCVCVFDVLWIDLADKFLIEYESMSRFRRFKHLIWES